MKKLMILAVIAMVLTVFNSCKKEDLKTIPDEGIAKTSKADIYLENGYLAFKNMDAVDSVINVLSKMSREEKDAWEQKIGLKSARAEFDKLFDEYEKITTKEEFLSFKSKNSEKLKFNEMDETDGSIAYPYKTIYFLPVLNSQGIYKVGNSIIKYTREDQIIILNGDINILNNLEANIGNKNVVIMPRLKSGDNTSVEYDNFGIWYTVGKRRMRNSLTRENYWYDYGVPCSGWKVILYQTGQAKGLFGVWNDYKTVFGLSNVSIKVADFPTFNYSGYPDGSNYSPEVYSVTTVLAEDFVSGSNWMFNYAPSVVFSADTYSRGIGVWYNISH